MTWDPYGMPHAPTERPHRTDHRQQPQPPSASGRAVAAVLGAMAILALVFIVAANAQQTTSQTGTDQGQVEEQAPEQQAAESEQSAGTGSMQQAEPASEAGAPAPVDGQIVAQPEGTFAASELIGRSVHSAEAEDIGQISDLLIGVDNQLVGVVIGIGGFLGIGEKPIAVEVERLSRASTQDGTEQLVLDYTRAELEQAPEFVTLAQQRQEQAQRQAQQEPQQQQGAGTAEQPSAEGQPSTQ